MGKEYDHSFTLEEWETCIKVLKELKKNPLDNPDNQLLGGLITKIYKKAKKEQKNINEREQRKEDYNNIKNTTIIDNALNNTTVYSDTNKEKTTYTQLNTSKTCYCCYKEYTLLHSFYNKLCPDCAEENYHRRFIDADLKGRNVILTGGRVKVGFATALKLLRSNANLMLTTRFPGIALDSFKKEKDYNEWKDRLKVYGLDLRNLKAVSDFIEYYKSTHTHLDILINNAAQTIKYDEKYYSPLINQEQKLLQIHPEDIKINITPVVDSVKSISTSEKNDSEYQLTRFGQPVDTREKNSWNSTLEEISVPELLETNLINHISPYILIKELKPLMLSSEFSDKFIINVTSSEGIFSYINKTIHHPHTNMTKAALNMMTKTSAPDFIEDSIIMCAVDVGWISTGVNETIRNNQFERLIIPPLDPVDGASRILHPIIEKLERNTSFVGDLLKNYRVNEW
ncbi:MAG: SDR family NAD(P)-dependent oxidoreductase [Hyphomicrobiales bacterium]